MAIKFTDEIQPSGNWSLIDNKHIKNGFKFVQNKSDLNSILNESEEGVHAYVAEEDKYYKIKNKKFVDANLNSVIQNLNIEQINITNEINLKDALGIQSTPYVVKNYTDPSLELKDITLSTDNYFSSDKIVEAEYGALVIDKDSTWLNFKINQGSSGDIETEELKIKISQNGTDSNYNVMLIDGIYKSKSSQNYYAELGKDITIKPITNGFDCVKMPIGENTVEVSTTQNLVANKILNSNHTPMIISSGETKKTNENYPEKDLNIQLKVQAISYMYAFRSSINYTSANLESSVIKNEYFDKKKTSTGAFTSSKTTEDKLYYYIAIPSDRTLSSLYTTYNGSNSSVPFQLLTTTNMYGATNNYVHQYRIYKSNDNVSLGAGTITFNIT